MVVPARLWVGTALALGACRASSTPPAPTTATIETVRPAPPVPLVVAPRPPATSIVDEDHPHAYDGQRKSPRSAKLRGIREHEAWLSFEVLQGDSYDVVVDLETACVTETFAATDSRWLVDPEDDGDEAIARRLGSPRSQKVLGARLARLTRFDLVENGGVGMVRRHADGAAAVSADHRKIAIDVDARVFLSLDGGRTFGRADGHSRGSNDGLRFVSGDRYLTYRSSGPKPGWQELVIVDTTSPLPATPATVDLQDFAGLEVSSPRGLPMFTHLADRCFYDVDPSKATLAKITCVPGPDDEGRFAWELRPGVLRIDAPSGVEDVAIAGTPLGFDLHGRVVVFEEPSVIGTLDATRCSLVRRVPDQH